MGLTWTLLSDEDVVNSRDEGRPNDDHASASAASSSTETVSSARPSEGACVQGCESGNVGQDGGPVAQNGLTVHIESADLESFMLSLEGTSAYRAWMSGGFSDLQVQQLYGTQVLQAFLAHKLVSGDVA